MGFYFFSFRDFFTFAICEAFLCPQQRFFFAVRWGSFFFVNSGTGNFGENRVYIFSAGHSFDDSGRTPTPCFPFFQFWTPVSHRRFWRKNISNVTIARPRFNNGVVNTLNMEHEHPNSAPAKLASWTMQHKQKSSDGPWHLPSKSGHGPSDHDIQKLSAFLPTSLKMRDSEPRTIEPSFIWFKMVFVFDFLINAQKKCRIFHF